MMMISAPDYEKADSGLLICQFCSRPIVAKNEIKDVNYVLIEPGKTLMDYNFQESMDFVFVHPLRAEGCGREVMIFPNYLKSKKQTRARKRPTEDSSDDNTSEEDSKKRKEKKVTVKKPRNEGGRIGSVVTNFMKSRDITNYTRAVVREEMYNTFIIDFGRLYHRSMISMDTRRLVSTRNISEKDNVSHVKRGVIFPDGFKTITVTKGYIHEIQIHHDNVNHIPLYKIFVYDKNEDGFPLIASNDRGYQSAQEAFQALSEYVTVPVSPKIVTGIEYSGVQKEIIDHFKNNSDDTNLLIDRAWLDML